MTKDGIVVKKVIHAEPRGKRTEDWVDIDELIEAYKRN